MAQDPAAASSEVEACDQSLTMRQSLVAARASRREPAVMLL